MGPLQVMKEKGPPIKQLKADKVTILQLNTIIDIIIIIFFFLKNFKNKGRD